MAEERDRSAERKGGVRSGQLNVRFSDVGRYLMDELQEQLGLSQGSIIEMLLREEARRRGIIIPGSGEDRERRKHDLAESIRKQSGMTGDVDASVEE